MLVGFMLAGNWVSSVWLWKVGLGGLLGLWLVELGLVG